MENLPKNIEKIVGGKTYSLDQTGMSGAKILCFRRMVLKIEKTSEEADNEARMLVWLQNRLPVPEVIAFERYGGFNFLLESRMPGKMSCDKTMTAGDAIPVLAQGLERLWALDISGCPYVNDSANKLKLIGRRAALGGLGGVSGAEPETYGENGFSSPEALFAWLQENKPEEDLVFSHGDYCLPNVFADKGKLSGFIDLGRGGAADKWQDVALCLRSLGHNFGEDPRHAESLLKRLGLDPDPQKMKYYLLMDELF